MIILPRRFIDVDCSSRAVGMSGEYNLRIINPDGSVKSETGWFPNIILDSGLNRWGTGGIIAGAAIGTGTSTPVAAQTALDAQTTYTTAAGSGNAVQAAQGSAPYYITYTAVYRTALGALNGNYSEVGVGWASGSMFSRALILDGGGSPTTITVLSAEQLDIVYRLRVYPPTTDIGGSFTIGGVSYTLTGRASSVTSASPVTAWGFNTGAAVQLSLGYSSGSTVYAYNGAIGAITAAPSGSGSNTPLTVAADAYVNNSTQRTAGITFGLAIANLAGGIRSTQTCWTLGSFQYDFGASIPKDATKTLVMNYSINWARRP